MVKSGFNKRDRGLGLWFYGEIYITDLIHF